MWTFKMPDILCRFSASGKKTIFLPLPSYLVHVTSLPHNRHGKKEMGKNKAILNPWAEEIFNVGVK